LRDVTGSYRLAFSGAIVTSVLALVVFLVTPKPPPYPSE
jgi:hypothetical protein